VNGLLVKLKSEKKKASFYKKQKTLETKKPANASTIAGFLPIISLSR
jgi:hypothetical protein